MNVSSGSRVRSRLATVIASAALVAAGLVVAPVAANADALSGAGNATPPGATATIEKQQALVPLEPPPSCGDHVTLIRHGAQIRVTGVDLGAFMPPGVNYGLSDTYEHNGTRHGPYNASRSSGFNYQFTSDSSSRQQFRVVLSNTSESTTYCASYYTK